MASSSLERSIFVKSGLGEARETDRKTPRTINAGEKDSIGLDVVVYDTRLVEIA